MIQSDKTNTKYVHKKGVGNRIDSVLSQAMYFGLAFSRVGLDFRALMVPIFEEAILEQFRRTMVQAGAKFDESVGTLNWSELALADNLASMSSRSAGVSALDSSRGGA